MVNNQSVTNAQRPATMSAALPHAASRVRLAKIEQTEAVDALMRAKDAVKAAEQHLERCDEAAATAVMRLSRLAETGRVDAYCLLHDLFYTFEPVVPKKADGSVDHYTKYDGRWMNGGIPPCPECAPHDAADPAERAAAFQEGVLDSSRQNWML